MTKEVRVGRIGIGGNNPVRVQSMLSVPTHEIDRAEKQIEELLKADCEIIRIAIPRLKDIEAFKRIREDFPDVPFVADVHFNYRIAIKAAEVGADKVRINPGNIGKKEWLKKIIDACKSNGIPIRIGVNSGSLEVDLIDKYGGVTARGMVESALKWIKFFEDQGFDQLVISVKSSSVRQTIEAYRLISKETRYPLHVGVTEAGPLPEGAIKSAIGIGALLADGIGDTIRVSLTADPVEEVKVAWQILEALELRARGPMIISCPTCARVRIDVIKLVNELKAEIEKRGFKVPVKVAVMGCEVNGPGEARDADIGVAAAPGAGLIFKKGKIFKKVPEKEIIRTLIEEIEKFEKEWKKEEQNGT